MSGRGLWFFKLQHSEATLKQTVLNRWLIYQALPAKICMQLIVLAQASVHNLSTAVDSSWWGNSMCLGSVIAFRGLGVLRGSWQKKDGGRKITVSCLRQSKLKIMASQELAANNNALISPTDFYFFMWYIQVRRVEGRKTQQLFLVFLFSSHS